MFDLGQPCGGKVSLLVEYLSESAKAIGLTRETVEMTVRSRLRGARIYDANAGPYLYVNTSADKMAFSISFEFKQKFFKPQIVRQSSEIGLSTNFKGDATGWNERVAGTHVSDSGFILQYVGQLTDIFIDEYLRVNEKVCELSE